VDMSAVLTTHLHTLCGPIDGDTHHLTEAVAAVTGELSRAVPSYLGVQLVLFQYGHPVTLTLFLPGVQPSHIGASLQVALPLLGVARAAPDSTFTCYAAKPGAFVDLAADLTYALQPPGTTHDPTPDQTGQAVRVDDHLQPTTVESGVTGAATVFTLNRAIGILIGTGHHPDHAHDELIRKAAADGVSVLACATQLVRHGSS
jgi:hypothetical protein